MRGHTQTGHELVAGLEAAAGRKLKVTPMPWFAVRLMGGDGVWGDLKEHDRILCGASPVADPYLVVICRPGSAGEHRGQDCAKNATASAPQ